MLHPNVFHNDTILPIEQTRLSPGQGGLLNGWGLFTTMRISQSEPFAFERHWKRLEKDAARIRCPLPFDAATVRGQLRSLIAANRCVEGSARIYVIHNAVGFWRSDEPFPQADLLMTTAALPAYREPARLNLRENGRHAASPLAGVKVTSWLQNVWCLGEAQSAGYDEVILLNERGEVAECTAANIFCARGSRILTPPLSSGCLEGVTRATLLEIGKDAGFPVEECVLRPEDLYVADEVFISSTNRNVLAVGEIAGHRMPSAPGPAVQELEAVFTVFVRDYVARHRAPVART
jgi:branched-chain amino acid aminotransferase